MDVVLSFYKFFENWFFDEGTISLEDFAQEFWLARGVPESKMNNASYFVHLVSWYEKRNEDDVLILFFEDMKDDLEREVGKIAKFISTDKHDFTAPEIIKGATERSTYQFMKDNEGKFDEKLSKLSRNEPCGLPKDAGMGGGKIKEGKSGKGKLSLSNDLRAAIHAKWIEVVTPITGCETYAELREKEL